MPAIQIEQGTTAVLIAPALSLGTVTTDEVIFIGPAISITEAITHALPYDMTTAPIDWSVQITLANLEANATFTVFVPLDATVSTGGGYNLAYFDSAGNYYSAWFDVIASGTTPTPEVPVQLLQGQASALSIPLSALTYKAKFISVESPDAGTWLDNGAQTPLPYVATFTEAPAPAGWVVTLNSLVESVAYQSTITIPPTFELGVYTVTVSDGNGHIYEREFEVIPPPPSAPVQVGSPCGCYTGFDVVDEVQVLLGESASTTAQQQSQLYLRHVERTLDEVARKTWSIFNTACIDIIAGKVEYEIPSRPYELRSICINDGNGNVWPLSLITVAQADQMFYNWQNTTYPNSLPLYSGTPTYAVDEGANRFWLLPTPAYNQANGLIVRGYWGVDKFYQMNQCLPLPEGFAEVVVMGTAYRRCREMQRVDPTYTPLIAQYKAIYEELLRRHFRERYNKTESTRNVIPSLGNRFASWSVGWSWSY